MIELKDITNFKHILSNMANINLPGDHEFNKLIDPKILEKIVINLHKGAVEAKLKPTSAVRTAFYMLDTINMIKQVWSHESGYPVECFPWRDEAVFFAILTRAKYVKGN